MTYYKCPKYVQQMNSEVFDKVHKPGEATPHSGIYRCGGCGATVASNSGNPLPPQNHHQHNPVQGLIRWQMIVWA